LKVLIACEYSATVRDAFREIGVDAYSCDVLPTIGDDKYHYQTDVFEVINSDNWDMMIAFPPCTYLTTAGSIHWPYRKPQQQAALKFVIDLYQSKVPKVAIENPTGYLNTHWRKPDQIIQPFQFGDPWHKRTCLWLKNMPKLIPTDIVDPKGYWVSAAATHGKLPMVNKDQTGRSRSLTFPGIAKAMADQWGR